MPVPAGSPLSPLSTTLGAVSLNSSRRRTIPSLLYRPKATVLQAVTHLSAGDDILRGHIERVGAFSLKPERDRFAMLVRSILSQQISTKAAQAIRRKLEVQTGGKGLTMAALAPLADADFRAAGLSGQKTAYLRDLIARLQDGRLDLAHLHRLSDEEVIEQLIQVKGIGHWTAQMFLMFSLGRLDVMPHGDLGIRSALRELYQLPTLPDKQVCLEIATPWRPYASIASWYIWRLFDLKSHPEMDASRYPF